MDRASAAEYCPKEHADLSMGTHTAAGGWPGAQGRNRGTTSTLKVAMHAPPQAQDSRVSPVTSIPMYLVILKTRVTLVGSTSLSCGGRQATGVLCPDLQLADQQPIKHRKHGIASSKPTHRNFLLRDENHAVLAANTYAGHAGCAHCFESILCRRQQGAKPWAGPSWGLSSGNAR